MREPNCCPVIGSLCASLELRVHEWIGDACQPMQMPALCSLSRHSKGYHGQLATIRVWLPQDDDCQPGDCLCPADDGFSGRNFLPAGRHSREDVGMGEEVDG